MPAGLETPPCSQIRWPAISGWAELLRQVYLIDALCCPNSNGRRRLLAFITDRHSIRAILARLGLPTDPPQVAAVRPPPLPAPATATKRT